MHAMQAGNKEYGVINIECTHNILYTVIVTSTQCHRYTIIAIKSGICVFRRATVNNMLFKSKPCFAVDGHCS